MIQVQFVTGPYPMGSIKIASPYELVGEFLWVEVRNPFIFTWLLDGIESVRQGSTPVYHSSINAHEFKITKESVRIEQIEEYVGGPPLTCELPLEEFMQVLLKWRDHLEGKG